MFAQPVDRIGCMYPRVCVAEQQTAVVAAYMYMYVGCRYVLQPQASGIGVETCVRWDASLFAAKDMRFPSELTNPGTLRRTEISLCNGYWLLRDQRAGYYPDSNEVGNRAPG